MHVVIYTLVFFRSSGKPVCLLTRLTSGGVGVHSVYDFHDISTPSDEPNDRNVNDNQQSSGPCSEVLFMVMGIDHRPGSHYDPAYQIFMSREENANIAPVQSQIGGFSAISKSTRGEAVARDWPRQSAREVGSGEQQETGGVVSERSDAGVYSSRGSCSLSDGCNVVGDGGARLAHVSRKKDASGNHSRSRQVSTPVSTRQVRQVLSLLSSGSPKSVFLLCGRNIILIVVALCRRVRPQPRDRQAFASPPALQKSRSWN